MVLNFILQIKFMAFVFSIIIIIIAIATTTTITGAVVVVIVVVVVVVVDILNSSYHLDISFTFIFFNSSHNLARLCKPM